MQYLLLIYGAETHLPGLPKDPAEFSAFMQPWTDYNAELQDAGVLVGANALKKTTTATTVHQGDDGPVFTDGPFAETQEQLGGYYLIECGNLDDALKWVSKCPGARYGRVEVRPVMDLSSPPA